MNDIDPLGSIRSLRHKRDTMQTGEDRAEEDEDAAAKRRRIFFFFHILLDGEVYAGRR